MLQHHRLATIWQPLFLQRFWGTTVGGECTGVLTGVVCSLTMGDAATARPPLGHYGWIQKVGAWGPILVRTRPQRGGGSPPPSTDPTMVVQNNGFCGHQRGRRFCFRHTAGGIFFVRPYVSVLKILRILWRIKKRLKSTKKDFDPDPAPGSDLG